MRLFHCIISFSVYQIWEGGTTNEKGKAERTDNNYYYDFNGNQTLVTYNNVGDYNSLSADKPFKISAQLKLVGNSEERSYNGFNELTHISGKNNNVSLTYRPDGLILKNNNNYYAWQGDHIIYEFGTYYTRGLGLIKASTGVYYLQNGHGDISALAKENGTVSTRYMYDAFGNSSYTGEYSDNLFKYCGEYEDSSLGGIYLRARIYNSGTGRFTTEDPVRDGLNWYAYCGNNPVMFVDPFGMRPTIQEAALMADHIYEHNKYSPYEDRKIKINNKATGWELIDVWLGRESMKMGIYAKTDNKHNWSNPLEYALVFKGTTFSSISDWINNFQQYTSSKSADMWDAIGKANSFVAQYSKITSEITFVGHSKGGAEAIGAAIASNKAAITFNPMVANLKDYIKDPKKIKNYTASMTHYVISGEALNEIFGENSVGKTIYYPTQHWIKNKSFNLNSVPYFNILSEYTKKKYQYSIQIPDPISNHSINSFLSLF